MSRFRSLMKNKKQNIKQSQPREVEADEGQKLDERDVKQIMQDHRQILQQERAGRVHTEPSYTGERETEEQVPASEAKPKVPKKKKEMNNESLVKMLYFKKYAGKSRSSRKQQSR